MENLTPMMKQFNDIKVKYPDDIIFFRMGDFYEMFGDDAVKASEILQITLTKRNKIPMCGVPYHAKDNYLYKLVRAGLKVAICEQLEDPVKTKKLVKRGVIELVTPGTLIDPLDKTENQNNNFITALQYKTYKEQFIIGLSYIDIATGDFYASEEIINNIEEAFIELIYQINPKEFVLPQSLQKEESFLKLLNKYYKDITKSFLDNEIFEEDKGKKILNELFQTKSIKGFGIQNKKLAIGSSAALIHYLNKTKLRKINHINHIKLIERNKFLSLNENTIRNLELITNTQDSAREYTLYKSINKNKTVMGARLLHKWILNPLISIEKIKNRQNIVSFLYSNRTLLKRLRTTLNKIVDIEKILAKISLAKAIPKDFVDLKLSLIKIEEIKDALSSYSIFQQYIYELKSFETIIGLIDKAVKDEEETAGDFIKERYSKELDRIRNIAKSKKDFLIKLQETEQKKLNISKLRIKYNKVIGYFFEVSKKNTKLIPDYYIKKQSLVNTVRYTIPTLTEYETGIVDAEEKIVALSQALLEDLRLIVCNYSKNIKQGTQFIAFIDILATFANTALNRNYTCPTIHNGDELIIKDARHPVVELFMKETEFIPNDFYMNNSNSRILIITGPNMAGKSTYLRQLALIIIMCQIGSFVPASEAKIPIFDKIFTRIGASDNIARGESTFLVEMIESAIILNNASDKSLIIMDEIGRGTSTYDGMSIAYSIIEYLVNETMSKVLFATHYHELTKLNIHTPIKNYEVLVKEWENEIIFLHKVKEGSANKSYGIQVAKLAGMPNKVIAKAKEILNKLQDKQENQYKDKNDIQPSLFSKNSGDLSKEILKLDTNKLSPATLYHKIELIQKDIKKGKIQ